MIDPTLFQPGGPLAGLMKDGQFDPVLLAQLMSNKPKLNQVDKEGGMLVQPDAGFVTKTAEVTEESMDKGYKTFINICGCPHIDKMHERSIAEGEAMGGEQGLRIPLSIGEMREDFDKSGQPCSAVDVVINSETLEQAEKDTQTKQLVGEFAAMAVGQKYKKEFGSVSFPKMKYKGTLPPQIQRIRASKLSQIEEISTEVDAPLPKATQNIKDYLSNGSSFVMGTPEGKMPTSTPAQPQPMSNVTSAPSSAAAKKEAKVVPNFSVWYYKEKQRHPLFAAMMLDEDEMDEQGPQADEHGVAPAMGMKLDATELPLFPPAEFSHCRIGNNKAAAARRSAFNFSKAVKGSKQADEDKVAQETAYRSQQAAAVQSIQGTTWRAVVPMPSVKHYPKAKAGAVFALAVQEGGITVTWNRRSGMAHEAAVASAGATVRNPPYTPLNLAFPWAFPTSAIENTKAYWDPETLVLTIDVPVPSPPVEQE